jgi:hypothetical protein
MIPSRPGLSRRAPGSRHAARRRPGRGGRVVRALLMTLGVLLAVVVGAVLLSVVGQLLTTAGA